MVVSSMSGKEAITMGFLDNITMALSSLKANKMRAILTMLGIIIGIASVIGIMTIGGSLSGSVTSELSSFGITNITLSVTEKDSEDSSSNSMFGGMSFSRDFGRTSMSDEDLITTSMINDYRNAYGTSVSAVVLQESVGSTTVYYQENDGSVSITGVNDDYQTVNEVDLITGRWLNDDDNENLRKVCVISDVLAEELFGSTYNAIGKSFTFTLNGFAREFYVVGIYEYENNSTMSNLSNVMTSMYIPLQTAKRLNGSSDGFSSITIVASTDVDSDAFLTETQRFFATYYTHNDSYTVEASNLSSMLEAMESILSSVTIAISAIAAISLLVGGIGVMNIMLVSITERTREIGTRKALGATQNDIRMQFITESVIICLIGGFIGIILGLGIGYLGASLLGFTATPSVQYIVLSVVFSMGVGIFFGYYPANKAAKLNPIDALRYE